MATQTNKMLAKEMNRGIGATMKRESVVEHNDARKALHDLFFETGSLPGQEPKIKVKELDKARASERTGQAVSLLDIAKDASLKISGVETSKNQWVKPAIYFTLAICLVFGAYLFMPRFEMSNPKPSTHHVKSPLIREALEKRESTNPTPQGGPELPVLGSLALTPSVIMAQYVPGRSSTQTLTIDNQTPKAMTFEIEAVDLVANGDQVALVPAGDSADSIAATAAFSQKFVRVASNDKATVQVTLTWPSSTNVRGVVARLRCTDEAGEGGAGLTASSLGTLITFARGGDSAGGSTESPTGIQLSEPEPLVISQWAGQNGAPNLEVSDAGTSKTSKGIKVPNLASLGGTQ